MNQITDLSEERVSRPGTRRARPLRQAKRRIRSTGPRTFADEGLPAADGCCGDIAERSLSLWDEVLRVVGEQPDPPSWVPRSAWIEARRRVATAGSVRASDIEGRLGDLEDLAYREAFARHRLGCAHRHAGPATADPWQDDLVGFRLRVPDQSVS